MLVPFPIAFFVATAACDLVFSRTEAPFWASGAGLIMAALAAVFGLIDVLSEPRILALNDAWWHAGGNVLAVLNVGLGSFQTLSFASPMSALRCKLQHGFHVR
jgi:uncharacterized membrane protein